MPLVCTQTLRKNWPFAIGSPGAAGGGPAEIPASSSVLAAGEGRATLGEYLGLGLHQIWGPGLRRCAGSTAVGSGRRCVAAFGEAGARPRQSAAGLAPAEARGAIGGVARLWKRLPARLGSGAHGVAAAGLSRGSGATQG
jgi:hypothetical protein